MRLTNTHCIYRTFNPVYLESMADLHKTFLTLGIGAFLFMSFFGMFHSMSMNMDGKMSDCPFMPGMNMCPMTPLEHASIMQSFFTNILPQADSMLALLLVLSSIALVTIVWFRQLRPPLVCRSIYNHRWRALSIEPLFQQLLSNGILNPKLFS